MLHHVEHAQDALLYLTPHAPEWVLALATPAADASLHGLLSLGDDAAYGTDGEALDRIVYVSLEACEAALGSGARDASLMQALRTAAEAFARQSRAQRQFAPHCEFSRHVAGTVRVLQQQRQ